MEPRQAATFENKGSGATIVPEATEPASHAEDSAPAGGGLHQGEDETLNEGLTLEKAKRKETACQRKPIRLRR